MHLSKMTSVLGGALLEVKFVALSEAFCVFDSKTREGRSSEIEELPEVIQEVLGHENFVRFCARCATFRVGRGHSG